MKDNYIDGEIQRWAKLGFEPAGGYQWTTMKRKFQVGREKDNPEDLSRVFDHPRAMQTRDQEIWVLIAQPYQITGDDLVLLMTWAQRNALEVYISSNSGYGHGTLKIEIRRQ